mmetsp:Transcript_22827/g.57258  ORF Transcript_22827/g.57258 Transcript_22827/m.57258 type:complete len:238 (-) Transcript_22827:447-1160(-)
MLALLTTSHSATTSSNTIPTRLQPSMLMALTLPRTCSVQSTQLYMYTLCLGLVPSTTRSHAPTWFSTAHLRPFCSSITGGPEALAAGRAGAAAAGAGPPDTRPLRSPRFLAFMSSVTLRRPDVTPSPLASSLNTADMPSAGLAAAGLGPPDWRARSSRKPGGGGGGAFGAAFLGAAGAGAASPLKSASAQPEAFQFTPVAKCDWQSALSAAKVAFTAFTHSMWRGSEERCSMSTLLA